MTTEGGRAEVAEWYTVPCLLCAAQRVIGSSPKPPPMLADMSAGMWIKKAWLPCWPLYSHQVSHQRGIWGSHKWESMQKWFTLTLKSRADITRSPKQGYQWPHEKNLCLPKIFGWLKRSLSQSIESFSCNPHFALFWPGQRSDIFENVSNHWGMVTYNFFRNIFFGSIIRARSGAEFVALQMCLKALLPYI